MKQRLSLAALALCVCSFTALHGQTTLQPFAGDPLPGLTPAELMAYQQGRIEFSRVFTAADGLGPIFNDDSCAGCHTTPTVGGSGTQFVTRFGGGGEGDPFDPLSGDGGSLLQANSINPMCQEQIPLAATVLANRVTPLAIGLGLIEGIPDADLIALANSGNGALHMVPLLEDPMAPLRVGRFGWKAQLATVESFSGDATLEEMGITNSILGNENAPNGDMMALMSCDTVPDPEEPVGFIDAITAFQRYSAPPPQTPKSGMIGEQVFTTIGCATCHVTQPFTTGTAAEAALTNTAFRPFSDFLLHDMGSLGDGIVQGDASETQFRTPPLWGLRYRDPLIHDGRVAAGTFEDRMEGAILAHAGDGQASSDAYVALPQSEKDQLFAFLDSLGKIEFDSNGDNRVDFEDFTDFQACFTGPGSFYTADDACAIHDVDQDGDVDLDDFDLFLVANVDPVDDCNNNGEVDLRELLVGTAFDCNENLIVDSCDIAQGNVFDTDMNGVPDECEQDFVRGDTDATGTINLADVINVLTFTFNASAPLTCAAVADIDGDDDLDLNDTIALLSFLFQGGPPPAFPYPDCAPLPMPGNLECTGYVCP